MIADPLWSCVMLLCGPLWVFCGSFVVLCGPLWVLCGPLRSFVVLCGPLRSFAVFSHTRAEDRFDLLRYGQFCKGPFWLKVLLILWRRFVKINLNYNSNNNLNCLCAHFTKIYKKWQKHINISKAAGVVQNVYIHRRPDWLTFISQFTRSRLKHWLVIRYSMLWFYRFSRLFSPPIWPRTRVALIYR